MNCLLKITPCDLLWVCGGEKEGRLGLHSLDFDLKKLPEFNRETVTIWKLPRCKQSDWNILCMANLFSDGSARQYGAALYAL